MISTSPRSPACSKDLGLRLAVDDFGTGYSSLSYLRDFPVDMVKIDKSFVDRITMDAEGRAMVRCLIDLSTALGLTTIAEGVEHRDQFESPQSSRLPQHSRLSVRPTHAQPRIRRILDGTTGEALHYELTFQTATICTVVCCVPGWTGTDAAALAAAPAEEVACG